MKKNLRAFGLVEVLVASIVIAVGLLGAALLQSNSLKNMKNNSRHMMAALLVDEMVQYIVANPREAERGASNMYNTSFRSPNYYGYHLPYISNNCFTSTGCNSWNIAANDIAVWLTRITENLGSSAYGSITFPSGIWFSPFGTLFDQNTPVAQYPSRVNYIVSVVYRDANGNFQTKTGIANTAFNPWRAIRNKPAATIIYNSSTTLPTDADCSWSYLLQATIMGAPVPSPPLVLDPIACMSCNGPVILQPQYTNGLNTSAYDPGYLTKADRNQICSKMCGSFGANNLNTLQYAGLCACNTSNMYNSTAMN